MAKHFIFRGAVPYDEALTRLDAAFTPAPGDLITHKQLAAVIQEPIGSPRYRGVVAAWQKRLYRDRALQSSGRGHARGIGLAILTPTQQSEHGIERLRQTQRATHRTAERLNVVDTVDFNKAALTRHNLARRLANEMNAIGRSGLKQLPAPAAVKSSNVRLFNKDAAS